MFKKMKSNIFIFAIFFSMHTITQGSTYSDQSKMDDMNEHLSKMMKTMEKITFEKNPIKRDHLWRKHKSQTKAYSDMMSMMLKYQEDEEKPERHSPFYDRSFREHY